MIPRMDVFGLRDALVGDYSDYVRGFMRLRDPRIREHVNRGLAAGKLWPDPSIGLNPTFAPGGWIDDLVGEGLLHPACGDIFRVNKGSDSPLGQQLRLHRHQEDAIRRARAGRSFVMTTGTGSGKSLGYIVPAVDHVLRTGSGQGIKALIVYPMNALANSQVEELDKFLVPIGGGAAEVSYGKYTGQESEDVRHEMRRQPPDILLTNYVMLELLLTRSDDRPLVEAMGGLRFLVLDELHTYRGRQGADVAFLCRRLREASGAEEMLAIGTSATMSSEGSHDDRRTRVADVASKIFGVPVDRSDVIGETLQRATPDLDFDDRTVIAALKERVRSGPLGVPTVHERFVSDPLSSWIESTFGVETEDGRLVRRPPLPLRGHTGGARRLADLVGESTEHCDRAIGAQLLAGNRVADPTTGFPVFAFRLHQFISKGDTVYASPESEGDRHLSLDKQRFVPGDRSRVLLPLAFCRSCGQEYYVVASEGDAGSGDRRLVPRDLRDTGTGDGFDPGYLYVSEKSPWPSDPVEAERLPDNWLEFTADGAPRVKRDFRRRLPERVAVRPDGGLEAAADAEPTAPPAAGTTTAWLMPAPFRLCLLCGVSFDGRGSEFSRLANLGTEGRSTATTVLSLSAVRRLRADATLPPEARKLLSFTDNRQDASLQAGHFNDFVQVALLRSALWRAASDAGDEGLTHDRLPQTVFDALALPFERYAVQPGAEFYARRNTERTMRQVLAHRLYLDLRRGWRLTAPNLEQCGLLRIDYESLGELSEAESLWAPSHPALATATADTRAEVCRVLLDFCRRELAIKTEHLDPDELEALASRARQHISGVWEFDDGTPKSASAVVPRSRWRSDFGGHTYLSSRGGFGRYLRRRTTLPNHTDRLDLAATDRIITDLFAAVERAGLLQQVGETGDGTGAYQVPAAAMRWKAGDGTAPYHDVIRMPSAPAEGGEPNPYFVQLYTGSAAPTVGDAPGGWVATPGQETPETAGNGSADLIGIEAREHTAQVAYEQRQEREDRFKEADLAILYCSPTMELGVDIAELNVVNMRNAPPTPANYAQRSGRAGRSGQPALVFTYCAAGSAHDQYFFRRPDLMVSGQVVTPRLELANEDLVRSHVQAVWLSACGMSLGSSLKDILDLNHDDLPLLASIEEQLRDPVARRQARDRCRQVLEDLDDRLAAAPWWDDDWLVDVLHAVPLEFERACERWRNLYRSARRQREVQHAIISDASKPQHDKRQAERLRREAEQQLELLVASDGGRMQSDFYSYRYFAGEGFLPGYNFPRLPLSAFIPGRRGRFDDPEYVNRPRFLAISEFGPRTVVYHEGSRYRINRVILPVGEGDEHGAVTSRMKRCGRCGYMHRIPEPPGPDVCDHCGSELGAAIGGMFRMQNVSTHRVDRISSDEEERQRFGFELQSGVRFADRAKTRSAVEAEAIVDGEPWARLTYGDTATIWRINLGWRRRRNRDQHGFLIDLDRGVWQRNEDDDGDRDDPDAKPRHRIIPYVEDSRNALLVHPTRRLELEEMASFAAALKHAVQRRFHLEDAELAVESLPDDADRRTLLLYEASEGGAGVLRQLAEEPDAFAGVVRTALEVCHYDPDTCVDKGGTSRPNGSVGPDGSGGERCEAACYDCLLSYRNQPDHRILDRQAARDVLAPLRDVVVQPSETTRRRVDALVASGLEGEWLDHVRAAGYREPDDAQVLIEAAGTRPDFMYRDEHVAVYVDGPHHDYPERAERDAEQTTAMRDLGWTVLRFGYRDDWETIFGAHRSVFGEGRQ